MYSLSRKCTYDGIEYKIISVLDNDLLLAVKDEDFVKGVFPMKTVLIPDVDVINANKRKQEKLLTK